ncbi:MAG: phosphopentomutase [Bacilli bacterium]|nr:phosphopentomutase [Bacilli bacterium]
MQFKRIFLIILDSLGVGEAKDAYKYNSTGANTLGHINDQYEPFIPNLKKIGFLDTINMTEDDNTEAYYTICHPKNSGIDSLSGHYEIVGIPNEVAFETFPKAFDIELLKDISRLTGRRIIGNLCCTDDSIIKDLGDAERNYGSLIIYTSGDSNLQVAAHEDVIPLNALYQYCERIRAITLKEGIRISRIIARPFTGTNSKTYRFINNAKKEYTITPNHKSILNTLEENKLSVIGMGKVNDIFANNGITKSIKSLSNNEGINKLIDIMDKDFTGLCLLNLNDFDELYGHNKDGEGYSKAIEELDIDIPILLNKLNLDDLLIITADHGCDPTFTEIGHTRENVPLILYSRNFKEPKRLDERESLADIAATIADNFKVDKPEIGDSFLDKLQ